MEKLKLKDFLDYNFISQLKISPDNKNACFVVSKQNVEENTYNSNIWIMNMKTKDYKQLSNNNKEKSFIWLNNTTIMFSSQRNNTLKDEIDEGENWTIYYTIDINGGEAFEYMRIPATVSNIKYIDEENFIITAEYDNNQIDLYNLEGKKRKEAIDTINDNKDFEVVDEIPFWANNVGFVNKKRNRLYLYNKPLNKLTPITDEYTEVENFKYKDGKILYSYNRYVNKYELYDGLNMYNIDKKESSILIPQKEYSIGFFDFIEDKIIVTLSDMKKLGLNQNKDIYILDKDNLKLLSYHDTGFGNSVGTDCRYGNGISAKVFNNKLYFISTISKCSYLNCIDTDGNLNILTKDLGSVDFFDICENDILFVGLRNYKLQEIYNLDEDNENQVTSINENIINTKTISKPQYTPFNNDIGIRIEGFVIKPVNYDENKQYPAILDIHGGPKTVFGEVYYHEMQVWANMGYFVFYCNPRGSDGRGDTFSDIRGKYGTIDYEDIMQFTDMVSNLYPQIDKNRIGVTGGSYGGFMTNWIIGHTNKFKCAASQRSISNWISKFGTTDIGYYFNSDQIQATPWNNADKLWYHSPLKYADKCVTPTLFIHSEQDYRCWLPEGIQMFTALKYHGIDSRLCIFKGENHELSRSGKPKHRIKRLQEMTDWFDKYLK